VIISTADAQPVEGLPANIFGDRYLKIGIAIPVTPAMFAGTDGLLVSFKAW
jgi:hypothetical protein